MRGDRKQTARLNLSPGSFAALGKVKNPAAPAVKREAEEDWARLIISPPDEALVSAFSISTRLSDFQELRRVR
jgi:hypothetical protein